VVKIVGDFIAAHSAPVALRGGILYVRVLQPALHYEHEQISKSEILRKLKHRFGGKTIRDIRFRVVSTSLRDSPIAGEAEQRYLRTFEG
jgi:Dna[CI] antecedent, DciA